MSTSSITDTIVDPTPSPSVLPKPIPKGIENSQPTAPSVIPSDPSTPRTLVLCFDGTGDQFDDDNSNIVHLVSMLKKGDQDKQLVYYHPGLGTAPPPLVPGFLASTVQSVNKSLDLQFAFSLRTHVLDGYKWLMNYYTAGDRICLFGFSRGAYTARALAGMLYKVGLLQPGNDEQAPFAYEMFCNLDSDAWENCNHFKLTFCTDVSIEFIGVWDTVNSVGLIAGKRLPFTSSNYAVRTFRHALSLDERRVKFKANVWNRPEPDEVDLGTGAPKGNEDEDMQVWKLEQKSHPKVKGARETDVEEVWFAGCHCDVGGGSVPNKTRHSLARIPLRWMIRECFKTTSGIKFETAKLAHIGLDPSTLLYDANCKIPERPKQADVNYAKIKRIPESKPNVLVRAWRGVKSLFGFKTPDPLPVKEAAPGTLTEEQEELLDAMSPMYDQLKLKWYWNILEYLPLTTRYQGKDNKWNTSNKWNRGNPRIIPLPMNGQRIKVHRSVKMRRDAEFEESPGIKYKPAAIVDDPHYVP